MKGGKETIRVVKVWTQTSRWIPGQCSDGLDAGSGKQTELSAAGQGQEVLLAEACAQRGAVLRSQG